MAARYSRGFLDRTPPSILGAPPRPFLSAPVEGYPADFMRDAFAEWLEADGVGTASAVLGMPWNFVTTAGVGRWIYPRLSAEKILWHLKRGERTEAETLCAKLLTWQQLSQVGGLAKSYGAFPSLVTWNGSAYVAAGNLDGSGNAAYYAGDGLVILTGLCELYAVRPSAGLLTALTRLADWICDQMIDAVNAWLVSFGYAGDLYPVPFSYVDAAGNFSDQILVAESFNFIGALTMASNITGDASYGARVAAARTFYLTAQHAQGWWYRKKNAWPNYPDPPVASAWLKYHDGNSQVLADENLNCALGAIKMGGSGTAAAEAFYAWMLTAVDQNGGVPGYLLTGAAGAHGFGEQSVYFDVVSTGQWRSLCQWLGDTARAQQAVTFIGAAQILSGDGDGAWLWGLFRELGTSATGETADIAPHTGMWCTADLSTYGTTLEPEIPYDDLIPTKQIVSLTVTPAGVDIAGTPTQMTCTATWSDASTSSITTACRWHEDDVTKATIAQTGIVTPVGAGNSNAYATIGARTDAASLATATPVRAFKDCGTIGAGNFDTVVEYVNTGTAGNAWYVALVSNISATATAEPTYSYLGFVAGVTTVGDVEDLITANPACLVRVKTSGTRATVLETADQFGLTALAGGV